MVLISFGTQQIFNYDLQEKEIMDKYDLGDKGNQSVIDYKQYANKLYVVLSKGKIRSLELGNLFGLQEIDLKEEKIQKAFFCAEDQVYFANQKGEIKLMEMSKEEIKQVLNTEIEQVKQMEINKQKNQLICMNENTPISLFDIQNQKQIWKAKGNKGDEYGLQLSISNEQFFNQENLYLLQSYNSVQIYKPESQRKFVSEFNSGLNKDFSTICFCIKDNSVVIGNRVGNFSLLDLRNTKNPIKVFDIQQGGIWDIKMNQNNVIFTGIFSSKNFKCLDRLYFGPKPVEIQLQESDHQIDDNYVSKNSDEENQQEYSKSLKDERLLWHNNVPLGYQKKIHKNKEIKIQ